MRLGEWWDLALRSFDCGLQKAQTFAQDDRCFDFGRSKAEGPLRLTFEK